jgi:ATP-dependent DNA helicase RecG
MQGKLSDSIQYLKMIGPKRAESFSKIGIRTIRDLLFYFPTRYLDRSNILDTIKVVQYIVQGYEGEVTIVGQVVETETHYYNRKQVFKVRMKDLSGYFECVWFQGAKYFKDVFKEGQYFAISAKPVITRYGHLQFAHPDFDRLADKESLDFLNTGKIIPFYRVPKQLREANIGDFSVRRIIHSAAENYSQLIEETLPDFILKEKSFSPLSSVVHSMHFPFDYHSLDNAKERLKFEEIFYFECLVAHRKKSLHDERKGLSFKVKASPLKSFLKTLPYELTKAQLKVLGEIRKDLESNRLMNRLLQGDVGSGKTIVALIAMLIVIENGFQCSFMVPTEILSDQHYKRFSEMLSPLGIKVSQLISGQKKSERTNILSDIKSGKSNLVVGTHALIESYVEFNKLGLVVIDEQHRFGVLQRSTLSEKGNNPDVLIMTATPIPRTLSITVYGDLDISIIDELPKNRITIKTTLRGENKLSAIYDFIKNRTRDGYQSFIVYPLVEDSEKLELKAATTYFEQLQKENLKELKIGLIHGRMNWLKKEQVMFDFAAKKYDVLVSTTVIEVGIDIPDANIIVINNAERFGLSQLHQLRGRVGRSDKQAYCILVTKNELAVRSSQFNFNADYLSPAQIENNKSIIRLNAMVKYPSGFDLSEIDLKLRGPGNIYGIQQSGLPDFKFINIVEDIDIITEAKKYAFDINDVDPDLSLPKNYPIKKVMHDNFISMVTFSHIA